MNGQSPEQGRDFLTSPTSAVAWWGLPLVVAWSAEALPIATAAKSLVWAGALAWMGLGCALNAVRCHRLHCYLAAPILFFGAGATVVVAMGFEPLGDHSASYVINGSLALAVLTFLVEPIWGRRRRVAIAGPARRRGD